MVLRDDGPLHEAISKCRTQRTLDKPKHSTSFRPRLQRGRNPVSPIDEPGTGHCLYSSTVNVTGSLGRSSCEMTVRCIRCFHNVKLSAPSKPSNTARHSDDRRNPVSPMDEPGTGHFLNGPTVNTTGITLFILFATFPLMKSSHPDSYRD